MYISRRTALFAATAGVVLALSACGTTEEAEPATTAQTAAGGPVEVTDERGTVKLDAPATKVVSLEWGLTENLLALGVKPVGAADVKGYNAWATVVPLPADTPDVGTRGEPSLEAVAALDPDLVVTTTDLPDAVIKQLTAKVPVLALRGSDGSDPLGYMRRTVTTLATATGTTAQGQKLLTGFDAKVSEGRAALAAAGKAEAPFTMADGWQESGNVSIRLYTSGSFFGAIADELGLKNGWTGEGDKDYGLATTDVEGLTKVKDPQTTFFYAANASEGDVFAEDLPKNAIWKQLPWKGNTHKIPEGIWMFGGPPSAGAYVDALVSALT